MRRLAGFLLLVLLALPVEASNPNRIKKERSRPVETAEPPLARPIPAPQPAATEPMVTDRVVLALACPQQAVARLVRDRIFGEAEDLRQAREDFHRFWTNNQPRESKDLRQAREAFHKFWNNNEPPVIGNLLVPAR